MSAPVMKSSKTDICGFVYTELKLFLTQEWNVASLDKDLFREMYEALFKATKNEKEHFDKQTMPNPKSLSGLRLQQCAAVLRAAVEACVELIKKKDVRALTQYFTKILHNDDGELCESLALDCIKALRVLYQYAPHTEHLKQKEWDQIAGLCCTHVSSQLGLDNEEKGEDGVAEGTSRGRAIVLVRENTTRSRRTAGVPQISPAVLSHQSDELLGCLQSLLAAPNSPIQANQEMLLDTLLGFLGSQLTHTRAHQHVFSSLNLVLNVIATGDISLVTRVADEIVPVIGRIWDTKSTGLKNEMVITLMHCLPYIRARIRTPEGKALRNSVENLLETLTSQYIGRLGRDILQLDDITFPSPVRKPEGNSLSIRVIALRTNVQNSHAEQIWMMPCIIASLVKMLDICGEDDKCKDDEVDKGLEDGDVDESRKKRRRIYGQFSEMMRYVRSTGASRKLLALQVIPFLADNKGIDEKQFASILQDLQETCTDESPNITGWALVSIGR